ncbi:MAG TPA: hypothetical protein VGN17_07130 [Bryobacteraceae bacterium]|jgi:hypothetical protein
MMEKLLTGAITVSSILLFCYWFRYTCQLILSAATSRDYATSIAQSYRLGFLEAKERLLQGAPEWDGVKQMLDRDYAVLMRLMEDAGGVERRMLAVHYSVAGACFKACRTVSPAAARKALDEMTQVVAYFANSFGEAAASPAAA